MNPEWKYEHDFEALPANDLPAEVLQMREGAFDYFRSQDFPTTHQEDWRFTNVAPIAKTPFRSALLAASAHVDMESILPLLPGTPDDYRIVLINGRYSHQLSRLPSAFTLTNLNASYTHRFMNLLGSGIPYQENVFTALNTAFLHDGVFLTAPNHFEENKPVYLVYVSTHQKNTASFPRNLVHLGKGSRITMIESYLDLSSHECFTSAVTEIFLEEGAILQHLKEQREAETGYHISTTRIKQNRDSSYTSFAVTLGALLSRENLSVVLEGQGATCALNGLYLIGRNQHADHHTTIDHALPHGTSTELYKGILDGHSRAVFNGKIIVRKDAQHTNARQTNQNLLLSEAARINTTPQLEIRADDVKCNHGATIGHLDEEALFYLEARGLSPKTAERMLLQGFLRDVTDRIPNEALRLSMEAQLLRRLAEFTGEPA